MVGKHRIYISKHVHFKNITETVVENIRGTAQNGKPLSQEPPTLMLALLGAMLSSNKERENNRCPCFVCIFIFHTRDGYGIECLFVCLCVCQFVSQATFHMSAYDCVLKLRDVVDKLLSLATPPFSRYTLANHGSDDVVCVQKLLKTPHYFPQLPLFLHSTP